MKRCLPLLLVVCTMAPGQWRKFSDTASARGFVRSEPAVAYSGPLRLPAGMLINVHVGGPVNARLLEPNEPILFEVATALRPFRNGPAIPSGSLITARVVDSKPAGRIAGKAALELAFEEILLPTGEDYPISAKVVDARGLTVDAAGRIHGRGHAKADAFLYAFPPTAPFRIARIPGRGPDLRFKSEQLLTIKLMEPLTVGGSQ
jgi:hypothetical protein